VQPGGPPLLIGGSAAAAFRRMTEFGATAQVSLTAEAAGR
jgi:hypothetical protein